MTTAQPQSISSWARFLGVTLRPWAGYSPGSLIVRGTIQSLIAGLLVFYGMRLSADEGTLEPAVRSLLFPIMVVAILTIGYLLLVGLSSLVVGILDLGPRKTITGQVRSQRERKFGDFLPRFVQRQIWSRSNSSMDRRRTRWEVVISTDQGDKALTVRKIKTRNLLKVGAQVTVKITPIAQYVDKAVTH